jgi:plastocyanin
VSKRVAFSVALMAALATACAGHSGGNGGSNVTSFALPGMPDLKFTAKLPSNTVGIELPADGLGTVKDTYWRRTFGHFSQQQYSQALGFPPSTQITLSNIDNVNHTFNVVRKIEGPPANFPRKPNLSFNRSGSVLEKGYASGILYPGNSVSVTLGKKGIFLIGCAYHYLDGMRDVIVVEPGATPGPQGTAPPR